MKTQKNNSTEELPASVFIPIEDSKIEKLTLRFQALEKRTAELAKSAHLHYVFCDNFMRERRGAFDAARSAKELVDGCRTKFFVNDADTLGEEMALWKADSNELDGVAEEKTKVEASLRALLNEEGSRFDAEIIATHQALVNEIVEHILPVCTDRKEALLIARGMNRPTQLYSHLYAWRRGHDIDSMAMNFVRTVRSKTSSLLATNPTNA